MGSVLCSLSPPGFSHKMVPSPFKMVACENKMDAASGFPCDRAGMELFGADFLAQDFLARQFLAQDFLVQAIFFVFFLLLLE